MALTGTYHRTLDSKQRLAVPKQFRDQFGGTSAGELFLAPETEQSLGLYSAQAFEQRAHKLGQRSGGGAELQRFLRLYYSQASGVELDAQGRIRVPDRLIEFAGLKEEVVLLGVNDHVELWDRERWDQFLAQHGPSFDQLAVDALE